MKGLAMIADDIRLIDMTKAQLVSIIKEVIGKGFEQPHTSNYTEPQKEYEYGIAGIARIFGCSKSTADRIKAGGIIDRAITQSGRTIVIDKELALELMRKHVKGN